mmetsp:Transcript_8193/g.20166  ORF Transcript_8193/g.20166 Transcript_8193/m.20166 type:complete len:696 (-) Transcript_8193:107-2194(-)
MYSNGTTYWRMKGFSKECCSLEEDRNECRSIKDDPDEIAVETELDREYRIRCFFAWGPLFKKWCTYFLLANIVCTLVVPGARFNGCIYSVFCTIMIFLRKHVDRQKGEPNEDQAMHFFGSAFVLLITASQLIERVDDSATSEEAIRANVPIIALAFTFCFGLLLRISWTPTIYRHAIILMLPAFAFQNPRLGVFGPYYEALALLLTMGLGELIGNSIDEMQRSNFILVQKSNRLLLTEMTARGIATEELLSYRENVSKEKDKKERAARQADCLLNHTLKNIMADGIASVELYEQNGDREYLKQAKLSMKHGMWWTRRRQSLFMVCQGTYRPKKETVNLQKVLLECVNGRQIDKDWAECSPSLFVETDPTLLSLAFENGISNAIKHNGSQTNNPLIIARVVPGPNSYNDSQIPSTLEVIIQNNATPGALFISEEVETRLFEEGTHGKLTTVSSDGIGLGHARMMTELLRGKVSLRQTDDIISYTIRVPTKSHIAEPSEAANQSTGVNQNQPVESIVEAPRSKRRTVKPSRGMFIDDSLIARKYAGKMLFPKILGMKDWTILGENQTQLDLSVSFATAMNPDIIIIDEDLELPGNRKSDRKEGSGAVTYSSGTQICRDLVKAKVGSLLCIRSGNSSPEEVQKYIAAGAHCIICKSFDNTALAAPLTKGFQKLRDEQMAIKNASFEQRDSTFPILLLD